MVSALASVASFWSMKRSTGFWMHSTPFQRMRACVCISFHHSEHGLFHKGHPHVASAALDLNGPPRIRGHVFQGAIDTIVVDVIEDDRGHREETVRCTSVSQCAFILMPGIDEDEIGSTHTG